MLSRYHYYYRYQKRYHECVISQCCKKEVKIAGKIPSISGYQIFVSNGHKWLMASVNF